MRRPLDRMPALRPITLHHPARIAFGTGAAAEFLAAYVRTQGYRRAWVLTSRSVRATALTLTEALRRDGVVVAVVDDLPPEPTVAVCEQRRALAREFAPDVVVAIGGGSVLDVAKLVAALHDVPHPVSNYFGIGLVPARRTALVCVPTTAGTGSEVSPNALLYDEAERAKKAVIGPALVPDLAVVDAALTVTLPPELTATTGLDALTHCIEVYANLAAHPTVDLHALDGVRLIGRNLARAVADGSDPAAREAVALGSLYGGLGLGPVNTAAVHALAYPLGGEFHLPHGLSIALLLAPVVRFNAPAMPARYAALARALGDHAPDDDLAAATACADRLEALVDACGVRRRMSAHGIPRDALPRMADAALKVTRLLNNNPRAITREDALGIYAAAF